MEDALKYRGQWGGKIETGEEMWWSEPDLRLQASRWRRWLFSLDVRQHLILRFWRRFRSELSPQAIPVLADYGCGTAGTTLNFSSMIGHPIHGFDVFETQLQIARRFAGEHGLKNEFKLLRKDGSLPVADGSVDALFSLDVLGHVPHIPSVLSAWNKALKARGEVLLFTEAYFSDGDRSRMAKLARGGADMAKVVPEHISLFPREELERMFEDAGFEIRERFSANVWHFLFFPKDYVLLLKGRSDFRPTYFLAVIWNRISKILPFYPWPFQALRLALTYLIGREAFGSAYFYHLRKTG